VNRLDIQLVIKELGEKNIMETDNLEYETLSGGTVSKLYLIKFSKKPTYVIKSNVPAIVKAESEFLSLYQSIHLLPKLFYVDPSYQYIVYQFLEGSIATGKNKKEMLVDLVEKLINQYQIVANTNGWGWVDEPSDSWHTFLLNRVFEQRQFVGKYLGKEDTELVIDLVNKHANKSTQPYLLHGDCGVHNFIFNDGKLTGVIDPTPVIGDPLYDVIYAFSSSPADLAEETIREAVKYLKNAKLYSKADIFENVIIGLYFRIGTCIKHHPKDLEEYLAAWKYWKEILRKRDSY